MTVATTEALNAVIVPLLSVMAQMNVMKYNAIKKTDAKDGKDLFYSFHWGVPPVFFVRSGRFRFGSSEILHNITITKIGVFVNWDLEKRRQFDIIAVHVILSM